MYGLGIVTAQTIQTDKDFLSIHPTDENIVFNQLELLLSHYPVNWIKIGMIPSVEVLNKIIMKIKTIRPEAKIVWDPVLSSSTGFKIHESIYNIEHIVRNIFMICPNWLEAELLIKNSNAVESAKQLSKYTNVYLKGGHNLHDIGKDYLFTIEGKVYPFRSKAKSIVYPKHGSGCVFSSALTSYLALHYPLIKACLQAKEYTLQFLQSSPSQLGYHKR